LEELTRGMTGLFFCNAGYLEQRDILQRRNVIESGWGVLKQNFFIEYHQSRSSIDITANLHYIIYCKLKRTTST